MTGNPPIALSRLIHAKSSSICLKYHDGAHSMSNHSPFEGKSMLGAFSPHAFVDKEATLLSSWFGDELHRIMHGVCKSVEEHQQPCTTRG